MTLTKDQEQEIIDLYQDPEKGLTNAQDIYKKLNKKYKLKDVKDVIKNIGTAQVFTKTNVKQEFIPIAAPSQTYQMDLMFLDTYKRQNSGFMGMLNIININTRKAYSLPIKNKTAKQITDVFQQFINDNQDIQIKSISNDKGKEFVNKTFKDMLKQNNIEMLVFDKAESPNAIMIIERFNQTLRQRIDKYLNNNNTKRYIDVLQKLVNNYNNTENNGNDEIPDKLDQNQYLDIDQHIAKHNALQKVNNKYQQGDNIRVLKQKKGQDMFNKGRKNYSNNLFNVIEKDNHGYQVEDDKHNIKRVLPFQMFKVNKDRLIQKQERDKNNIKKKDIKIVKKQQRKLNKEGISQDEVFNFKPFKKTTKI